MNFFDYQDRARKWTRLLVLLYALAVVLIVLAVYGVTVAAFSNFSGYARHAAMWREPPGAGVAASRLQGVWDPDLFFWSTLITLAILIGGTVYKVMELRGGGEVVARLMGGTPVLPQTTDPDEQRLRNVVEEMAIASGTPVPQIFVLPGENGINAFAAGFTVHDATITVTRGALRVLTRDELQGVVAHEFSHILNADMRMNVRLMGILYGLLLIALAGYTIMRVTATGRSSSREGKGGNPLPLLGLAVMVIGYIGVFFANLIKAAIGREREYLADASAAQFTRNPAGLAGALKKIAVWEDGGRIDAANAAQASHFFIAEPGLHTWLNLLDTHPPLDDRIRRLDPAFTGDLQAVERELAAERAQAASCGEPPAMPGFQRPGALPSSRTAVSGLADRVGSSDFQNVAYAATLLRAIPAACRAAAGTVAGAETVLFALVLSRQPAVRQKQMALLAARAPAGVYARVVFFEGLCGSMPEASRLPLADLAISGLRGMDKNAYSAFRENLMALAMADEDVDVFEFALLHMVARRLDRRFGLAEAPRIRYQEFDGLGSAIACVFSLLVWNGTADGAAAEAAYAAGWDALGETAAQKLRDRNDGRLKELEEHLDNLAAAAPQLKARLLSACAAIAAADGHTTLHEAETLRAIADALDCPVPPFAPEAEVTVA